MSGREPSLAHKNLYIAIWRAFQPENGLEAAPGLDFVTRSRAGDPSTVSKIVRRKILPRATQRDSRAVFRETRTLKYTSAHAASSTVHPDSPICARPPAGKPCATVRQAMQARAFRLAGAKFRASKLPDAISTCLRVKSHV